MFLLDGRITNNVAVTEVATEGVEEVTHRIEHFKRQSEYYGIGAWLYRRRVFLYR